MESTPDPDREPSGRRWPRWRLWAGLIGGLILFVVAFDLLERLVTPDEPGAAELSAGAAAPESILPRVEKLAGGEVQVSVGRHRRIRILLEDEAEADALIACIEEGIASSPALTGADASQPPALTGLISWHQRSEEVWDEVARIQEACMLSRLDAAIPPLPAPPPDPTER
jgi:hypothetical protein